MIHIYDINDKPLLLGAFCVRYHNGKLSTETYYHGKPCYCFKREAWLPQGQSPRMPEAGENLQLCDDTANSTAGGPYTVLGVAGAYIYMEKGWI